MWPENMGIRVALGVQDDPKRGMSKWWRMTEMRA